jgi:hypothetical protein
MGPNGLLHDMHLVLWKPCHLVKDEVTKWSAPVQELCHQCEGQTLEGSGGHTTSIRSGG